LSFVLHTDAPDFENWANPDSYFTCDNPEVQHLYAESLAATDEAEASELLQQAARIVAENHAADWLYNGASVIAGSNSVDGFPTVNVNERLGLARLTAKCTTPTRRLTRCPT
jgi:peptide/nickel transport system substrate-binding protein